MEEKTVGYYMECFGEDLSSQGSEKVILRVKAESLVEAIDAMSLLRDAYRVAIYAIVQTELGEKSHEFMYERPRRWEPL